MPATLAGMEVPVWKGFLGTGAPAPRGGADLTASTKPRQVGRTPWLWVCLFVLNLCHLPGFSSAAPPEWSVVNDPAFSRKPRCSQVNQEQHCSCDAGFHMSGTSDSSICQGEPQLRRSFPCSLPSSCPPSPLADIFKWQMRWAVCSSKRSHLIWE